MEKGCWWSCCDDDDDFSLAFKGDLYFCMVGDSLFFIFSVDFVPGPARASTTWQQTIIQFESLVQNYCNYLILITRNKSFAPSPLLFYFHVVGKMCWRPHISKYSSHLVVNDLKTYRMGRREYKKYEKYVRTPSFHSTHKDLIYCFCE